MRIVMLTNDNFFSYTVLKEFLRLRKDDTKLVIFSAALIGKRGTFASIKWSLAHTGLRHTLFKLTVYGVFKLMKVLCRLLPFIPNHYSSYLWIRKHSIPFLICPDINNPEVVENIKTIEPDIIVSVSMNQIVSKEILQIPPHRCINVHCAPLPRYGGMSPYVWALANNEDHSAATIHYMDEGLDTGDIVVQKKINVLKGDSAFALFYRCCMRAGQMLINVVNDIEKGTVTSYCQDLSQKSYFSWPTKQSVRSLRKHGFRLAKTKDILLAVFKQRARLS